MKRQRPEPSTLDRECVAAAQRARIEMASGNPGENRAGDLFASGTISGELPGSEGSLIELTRNGERPLAISGQRRTFLADGDRVVLRGRAGEVALGDVSGKIVPAVSSAPASSGH